MIKVAITDDHPMVITGISNMLGLNPQMKVAGTYASGAELLEGLKRTQPDVLLLDIQLPDKQGTELIRIVNNKYPKIRVLALTSMDTPFYVKDMMKHGCMGYVLKNIEQEVLIHAIEEVYKGNQYLEPKLKEELLQSMLAPKKVQSANQPMKLTRREKEILELIAAEKTNQEMAEQLYLSPKTIENHRFSLMEKLGAKNTAGLIKVAMRMGLVE